MMKTMAVIAAHPDDEILGCGGTIAKYAAKGVDVHVLILSEGLTSRADVRDREGCEEALSELGKAARQANKLLGAKTVELLGFPDNRMDSVDLLDVVKAVERFIQQYQPTRVYTHNRTDVNIDHQIIYQAVVTATRPLPGQCVKELLSFEVMSSTEWQPNAAFNPNWFEGIEKHLSLKLDALHCYASEMRDWPHSRSYQAVEHLAKFRGATIGCEAAEAFELGRSIYE